MRSIWGVLGLVLGLVLFQQNTFAQADSAKETVAAELGFIKQVFQTGYAPAAWKKAHLGWDLNTEYTKALTALDSKAVLTAEEYRMIVAGLLKSSHDYHVGFQFLTTENSTLPFSVTGTLGHYYIVWIDADKLNGQTFPFRVGDEIITWGGRPIKDVMMEIYSQTAWAEPTTDWRLAERLLTKRFAAMTLPVPQGQLEITVKHTDGTMLTRELPWNYQPETIDWNPTRVPMKPTVATAETLNSKLPNMSWGMWDTWQKIEATPNPFQIGGRKSWVPALGEKIWETADTDRFHAYIYRNTEGKLIGYVRIPSYAGAEGQSFADFKKIIRKFQTTTDALVIDEVNNPGGSVFYVLALMSVLSDQPIKVPDHAITLWPEMVKDEVDLVAALSTVKNDEETKKALGGDAGFDGFPVTYQFGQTVLAFARDVVGQWKAGHKITNPIFLYGVDKVNPDPEVNYAKPIIVLINELDFSGGDFFPAILQDNKRAKMFGQRTAGAGGYIIAVGFPSSLGLAKFSFTGSIARRVNNDPIENLGVTPDIPYEYTTRDMTSGFEDYKTALNAALMKEIAGK